MENQNSQLAIFNFQETEVRVISIENEPWFVAKDLCDVLELSEVSNTLKRLDDDEKLTRALFVSGQTRDISIVSESGMYNLVLKSRKPQAKAFQKWITSEVLPSIRKTGQYSIAQEQKIEPQKITDKTIEVHSQAIQQFSDSGDLQLAQLLKSRLGNLVLAEQQQLLAPTKVQTAVVEQYEGAVDVAVRLGQSVEKGRKLSLLF